MKKIKIRTLLACVYSILVWVTWFIVVIFGFIAISGIGQDVVDGIGPAPAWWEDVLFLSVLILPPLLVSWGFANWAIKQDDKIT